jgi:hypothetical protein
MFDWLRKKKKEKLRYYPEEDFIDDIEESLWEIKEEYDLPTEEIINVVQSKRKNIDHIHRTLKQKERRQT